MEADPLGIARSELEADKDEMVSLVSKCRRVRVASELQPWLTNASRQLDGVREDFLGLTTTHASIASNQVDDLVACRSNLDADIVEMAVLVGSCKSERVKRELQPWVFKVKEQLDAPISDPLSQDIADLQRDRAEMALLFGWCRRQNVKHALKQWFHGVEVQTGHIRASSSPPSAPPAPLAACTRHADLPILTLAGAPGTGKRRLLSALADAEEGSDVLGGGGQLQQQQQLPLQQQGAVLTAHASHINIVTKYYSAEVQCHTLDIFNAEAIGPEAEALLQGATAVVLLWDMSRLETFRCVQHMFDVALGPTPEDEADPCEGPERMQLCVAVEPKANAGEVDPSTLEEHEEMARAWCAERGLEHLRCPLDDAALGALRARRRAANTARGGRLLGGEDLDGTAQRVLEALESHPWPSPSGGAPPAPPVDVAAAPASAAIEPPLVFVAGVQGLGKRALVKALTGPAPGGQGPAPTEALLETRYYRVRLRFEVLDLEDGAGSVPAAASMLFGTAEGLILLWDFHRQETFESVRRFCASARLGAAVRLCVAVQDSEAVPPGVGGQPCCPRATALAWCSENAFEHLKCTLDSAALEALNRRWREGQGGRPLLESEGEADDGGRIVEALQCHAWPGLEAKTELGQNTRLQHNPAGTSEAQGARDAAPNGKPVAAPFPGRKEGAPEVETVEQFADEIRQVRAIADDRERRDRACDVAMQLAASLGIDDSDDDEA